MIKKHLVIIFLGLVILSGCAKKVKISGLEPALIDLAAKNIAVLEFEYDKGIGLKGRIEANFSKAHISGKKYFNVIDRKNTKQLIQEHKLQYSGLLNEEQSVEIGELLGAEVLISGKTAALTQSDQRHKETHRKCRKKRCKNSSDYSYYKVWCDTRQIDYVVNIRAINVTLGSVPFSDSISYSYDRQHCSDDEVVMLTKWQVAYASADKLAKQFVAKFVPAYKSFEVTLLDDEDIDYTQTEEELLDNSLIFIEQSRLDKAEKLLKNLLISTKYQSYVPAYNLGVVKEAQGELKQAAKYYHLADSLQVKPVKEINKAVNRIGWAISKRDKAKVQMKRKNPFR